MRKAVLFGVLTAAAVAAGAAPAAAASPAGPVPPGATVVTVTMTRSAMTLSTDSITAGNTVFKAVSGDGKDHQFQIMRLHRGYSLERFAADSGKAFNGDVKAVRRLDAGVTFRGGAEAHTRTGYVSVPLKPGKYYLLDFNGRVDR
jgi:hypothetical protein